MELTLYQISEEQRRLDAMLEETGGELTPEIEEALAVNEGNFMQKSRDYGYAVLRYKAFVEAIKAAYENGGRAAVSNRIERLVADGTLSARQGAKIHRIMQMAYDGLIGNVAAKIEDAACEDDPACPPCGAGADCPPCGERNEDADCGSCDDCKAKL